MKDCPKCGTLHSKPGKFCSRACANSRQWTEDHKKIFSEKQAAYMARDESEEHRAKKSIQTAMLHKVGRMGYSKASEDPEDVMTNPDDYFIIAPRIDIDGKFVEDGDLWEEV